MRCVPNGSLWHNPDLRLAAPEGRFTGGLLTLGAKIGKLPASEFSLARNQAANPSNEGVPSVSIRTLCAGTVISAVPICLAAVMPVSKPLPNSERSSTPATKDDT